MSELSELLTTLLPVSTAVIFVASVAIKWLLDRAREIEIDHIQQERTRLDLQRTQLEKCIDKVAAYSGGGNGNGNEATVQRMSALAAAIRLRRFLDPSSELGGAARIETTGSNWGSLWQATYAGRPKHIKKAPPYDKKTAPFARDVACFISAATRFTNHEYWQRRKEKLSEFYDDELPEKETDELPGAEKEPPQENQGRPTEKMDDALRKILVDSLAYAPPGTLNPPGCDFQMADLNYAYLGYPASEWRVDLSKADFYKADLSRASFKGAICKGTVFYEAICHKTVFTRTELSGANFTNAFCAEAKFKEATLDRANFDGAVLNKASFKSASLDGCSFEHADIRGCDFTDAKKIDHVKSWKGVKCEETTKFPEGFQYLDAVSTTSIARPGRSPPPVRMPNLTTLKS